MSTTYTPATNRYAFIAALAASGPTAEEQRAAALARARRRLTVLSLVEGDDDTPALPLSVMRGETRRLTDRETDQEERRDRRAALVAEYAAAFPTVDSRTTHAALVKRLSTRYEVSETYVHRLTATYRKARNLTAPRADAPHLARWQIDLLRYMADHGPVSAADLARHFGYASASNVSATISPLRRALAALTGDPDARAVIVTTHGCGYDLDRDAARRYPVIAAALEGCAS